MFFKRLRASNSDAKPEQSTNNNSDQHQRQTEVRTPKPTTHTHQHPPKHAVRHHESKPHTVSHGPNHQAKPHASHPRGQGPVVRIAALGGLEEVGKNMMMFEIGSDIMIIDMGLQFPEEHMLGVDYVIPDVSYLEKKKQNIRGIIITHGHLDHIGAIPQILPRLGNPPIYGTKLTLGLIHERLREFALEKNAKLNTITEDTKLRLGAFQVEFFRVNHSIPDGVGVVVKTPHGNLVHTGDFKFDFSPAGTDKPSDLGRIARIGGEGILAAFVDSTNASKPGMTKSEKVIGENLESIIANAKGRIIMASFSSLISRIEQVVKSAHKHNRKVFVSGRSMVNNLEIAQKLGYITVPKGTIRKLGPDIKKVPKHQALILTTGSQGEAMSALSRMSIGEHPFLEIMDGDTVVFSSSPIPGNEGDISTVINNLCIKGANVITNNSMDIHASGHAHQEDLKILYQLLRPKYLVPVHGMLYMRLDHKKLALDNGFDENQIIIANNGDVIEVLPQMVRKSREKIPVQTILIDGLGTGDIGTQVIQERKILANSGMVVVSFQAHAKSRQLIKDPEIVSKGFIYTRESQEIAQKSQEVAKKAYSEAVSKNQNVPEVELKKYITSMLANFYRKRLNREPMILPLITLC